MASKDSPAKKAAQLKASRGNRVVGAKIAKLAPAKDAKDPKADPTRA